MMMKNYILIWIMALLLTACVKNKVDTDKVITGLTLSSHSIPADGATKITLTVKLNYEAEPGKRGVIFKVSSGNFANGANNTITVQADYDKDALTAKAVYIAPLSGKKIYFSIMPDIVDKEKYTLYDSITVTPSVPFSIRINPSSFGLKSNFVSEDTVKAAIRNADGGLVSSNTTVVFEDVLSNHNPANGQFRSVSASSDASASVSAIYSIGTVPVGTIIYLKSTVLDGSGNKTNIKDSVKITITQ